MKWADYPEITTVDEYFDLLERYQEANPCLENGTPNIPFAILCDDWRYFCLENVPQFLDGYPNDGSCIVDPDTLQVIDYNTTPTAKRYYQKLNEEYKKGMISRKHFWILMKNIWISCPQVLFLVWWIKDGSFIMPYRQRMIPEICAVMDVIMCHFR